MTAILIVSLTVSGENDRRCAHRRHGLEGCSLPDSWPGVPNRSAINCDESSTKLHLDDCSFQEGSEIHLKILREDRDSDGFLIDEEGYEFWVVLKRSRLLPNASSDLRKAPLPLDFLQGFSRVQTGALDNEERPALMPWMHSQLRSQRASPPSSGGHRAGGGGALGTGSAISRPSQHGLRQFQYSPRGRPAPSFQGSSTSPPSREAAMGRPLGIAQDFASLFRGVDPRPLNAAGNQILT